VRSWTGVVLLVALCLATTARAQDTIAEPIEFKEVISADGTAGGDLYTLARSWFVETFNDSDSVLEVEDKDNFILMGKGAFTCAPIAISLGGLRDSGRVHFTIRVEAKDGRARITLSNFKHQNPVEEFGVLTSASEPDKCVPWCGMGKLRAKAWLDLKTQAETNAAGLIGSLRSALTEAPDDEW